MIDTDSREPCSLFGHAENYVSKYRMNNNIIIIIIIFIQLQMGCHPVAVL